MGASANLPCKLIFSLTQTAEGQNDSINNEYDAEMSLRNGKTYFRYRDEGASFLIVLSGSEVSVSRTGDGAYRMNFRPGEITRSEYTTPYGVIDMEIATESMELFGGESPLGARIRYGLSLNGAEQLNCLLVFYPSSYSEEQLPQV